MTPSCTSLSLLQILLYLLKTLTTTFNDILSWMNLNKLLLNPSKTEFLLIGTKQQRLKFSDLTNLLLYLYIIIYILYIIIYIIYYYISQQWYHPSQFLCSQSWLNLWLWHVFLWSNQLCIQILSFSYPRHPSNSSSSSSFYSHSSWKFTCLQQTRLLQFTLLWHLTNKSQQTPTHSKFIGTCHYKHFKISTHHTNTQKNYIGFLSNKELITKSVFSHTKHLQINNLHISTIVFHFRHILFLHDLLIHLFFPFHMSDHHLAKVLSLSSVHNSGIHSLLIPETRLLYQYSVPGSKHTFSKLRSLPRLFPISLDCLPGFWFLLFSFYALSNDT